MVTTRPLIFKFSSPLINPLMTVPSALDSVSNPVTFMFHSFFLILLQGPGIYLSFRLSSVLFWTAKSTIRQVLLFFVDYYFISWADCFPLEFEWQQVSRTLLSILAELNNAVYFEWSLFVLRFPTCPAPLPNFRGLFTVRQ